MLKGAPYARFTLRGVKILNTYGSSDRTICSKILVNLPLSFTSGTVVFLVSSLSILWAGHLARMGEERGVCRFLVGKPEGRRPMGRPRRSWVDNIRTDLQEVGCGYVDWIGLAQDRDRWRTLVSAVMNLRVP